MNAAAAAEQRVPLHCKRRLLLHPAVNARMESRAVRADLKAGGR
jgi:hypothetical protein